MTQSSFAYRILLVDDNAVIREMGKTVLETQGYEVITAGDGFEALLALKRSPPDIVISDLSMPNMSGFEFLSVVRQRFPAIPVIVISGEFTELDCPASVLTDAYISKAVYTPEVLFAKILQLLYELPARPRAGRSDKPAVWLKNNEGTVAVTCTDCLRTFPISNTMPGMNSVNCDYCPSVVRFEVIRGTIAP